MRRCSGLSTVHEDPDSAVFRIGETLINLLSTAAAPDLISRATVAHRASGSRFQLTIPVDDVDATCEELVRRGVTLLNGPLDRPWGVRTASFLDPAGHIWEVARSGERHLTCCLSNVIMTSFRQQFDIE